MNSKIVKKRNHPERTAFLTFVAMAIGILIVTLLASWTSCRSASAVATKNTANFVNATTMKPPFQPRPLKQFDKKDLGGSVGRAGDPVSVMPWNYYVPEYECTRGEDIIGRDNYGEGVWVCGILDLLQGPQCIVYIVGTSERTAFEADIERFTGCQVHVFSPERRQRIEDELEDLPSKRVFVHHVRIADKTDEKRDLISLEEAMDELRHDHVDFIYVAPHAETMLVAASVIQCKKWISQVSLGFYYDPNSMRGPASKRKGVLIKDFDIMHNAFVGANFGLIRIEENKFHPGSGQMLYGHLNSQHDGQFI